MLHIVDSLDPQPGGVAEAVAGLSRALRAIGLVSDVATFRSSMFDREAGAAPVGDSRFAETLSHASIVHIHGWKTEFDSTFQIAVRDGKRVVVSPAGGLCETRFNRGTLACRVKKILLGERRMRGAACVTASTDAEFDNLTQHRVHSDVRRLAYGIDRDRLCDPAQRDGSEARTALVLAPIDPREGLVPLLRAGAEAGLSDHDWNIVVAGAEIGDWKKMLEAAVTRKGATNRVVFETSPSLQLQDQLLRRASLLVSPALVPRFPHSVLRAMAFSVPVITTHHSLPIGLESRVTCCEPSREGIRAALRAFLRRSPDELAEQSAGARKTLLDSFTWEAKCQDFVTLYESVLGSEAVSGIRSSPRQTVETTGDRRVHRETNVGAKVR